MPKDYNFPLKEKLPDSSENTFQDLAFHAKNTRE
jgi:hypothetical protein